ncbi:hypothetical protein NHX12_033852 [Muraenolepis orangiensis]|uniref:MARVEL domain-containing protein n=1 Tax=Muraenolepis orangiensis TaxID=630683 RepID=A0A9Q0E6D1_9TELE|nr:hypothetical protein NHX12_033852 [Muraenolepis orangiensis]
MSRPPRNNHRDHRDRTGIGPGTVGRTELPPTGTPRTTGLPRRTGGFNGAQSDVPGETPEGVQVLPHLLQARYRSDVLGADQRPGPHLRGGCPDGDVRRVGHGRPGGFNINSNFNLQGTELQQVRELDMQFGQMRAPGIYGGLAFSLVFGVGSLVFTISGNRPAHRLPGKTLYATLVFAAVGAAAYVVAVGLYLHFVITVNGTDICQRRERLYARNGYTWMNCDVGGADAAVAMFGLITAILYAAATGLTFQTVRGVRRYRRDRERHRAGREAPLRADTTAV